MTHMAISWDLQAFSGTNDSHNLPAPGSMGQLSRVVILEACRSPEIPKNSEARVLAEVFTRLDISYALYSNDHIWANRVALDKEKVQLGIGEPGSDIVHLALHGDAQQLVLQWTQESDVRQRRPVAVLREQDILAMPEWKGKRILSGACHSASLAPAFLAAGASCVVAPTDPIPWLDLGAFFGSLYGSLARQFSLAEALAAARARFPEYRSYSLHSRSIGDPD